METDYAIQQDLLSPLSLNHSFFQGPLDLLLSLIRQKKMDIFNISLAEICQPFLDYIDRYVQKNLEETSEFFVIASTLILIKSKKLLPNEIDENLLEEDEIVKDPEEELKERLIEYNKFKIISEALLKKEILNRDIFALGHREIEDGKKEKKLENIELNIYQLLKSYKKVLTKKSYTKPYKVAKIEYSVVDRKKELLELFTLNKQYIFSDICGKTLSLIIVTFLALLELAQQNKIKIIQNNINQTIFCQKSS